jgi:HAD superfamily hydrolase (TIGR01509 family)
VTDALLFDFGGTLDADGVPWKERFKALYRAQGIACSDAVFDAVFHVADDALLGTLPSGCGLRATVERLADGVSAGLGIADASLTAGVARGFVDAALGCLATSRQLLARLRERHRLGLVSNFYGNLDAVCEEAGLAALFDVLIDSTRVGFTKPDARIFHAATDALGVTPARVTFIGDSPGRDMAGARALGMRHVWLTGRRPSPPTPCCPGDPVIAALAELEHAL